MCLRLEEKLTPSIKPPYLHHLAKSEDLVTTYEQVRAGFVALALERNRRSTPTVEQARSLKTIATKVDKPSGLISVPSIKSALLTAAGVSEKAASHMLPQDKNEAIQGLVANFLEPAGQAFIEELVFRFLLTKGDAIGGSMRNVGGVLAHRKLIKATIATLNLAKIKYKWLNSSSNTWVQSQEETVGQTADIELSVKGINWTVDKKERTLVYNVKVPIVNNNVDICLLNCATQNLQSSVKEPRLYVALGELKGGIDPAGADEHWKTASTALDRIRQSFLSKKLSPNIFFVGNAIEKRMAQEIWTQLKVGKLNNAANLTDPNQASSICHWLCTL